MISVNFNGNTAYLLDDAPDWNTSPELGAKLSNATERGLIGIETRRLQGDTPLLSLRFTALIDGPVAVTNLRNSLQALSIEQVLCPLWPAWFQFGDTPPMQADYYVLIGDGQAPEIVTAAEIAGGRLPQRPACPLMIGRLKDWPDPELITDDWESVEFNFLENDDSSLTPPAFVPPVGLAIAGGGVSPLFPFRPDWTTQPKSNGGEKDIERKNIGQSRMTADAYYTQIARRKASQSFTLFEETTPWQLLSFFAQIGVGNFWLPVGISEARLTADVAATDTALTVDHPANIGMNQYLTLDDLGNRAIVKVTGTAGSQWTLGGAVGTAFAKSSARLESTILARFADDTLTITFTEVNYGTADIDFQEVPYEVAGATTETMGDTFGPLAASTYLYTFTQDYPGGTNTYRFTNFQRDLTYGGNTYAHDVSFEHDPITENDSLERMSVQIKSRNAPTNPLRLLAPFALEYPLIVLIQEVDVNGNTATDPTTFFYGEVDQLEPDGPFFKATAESNSAIFDMQLPSRIVTTTCNWQLFSPAPRCGLNAADWTWAAEVSAWDAIQLLTITSITSPNAATLAANFFAGGAITVNSGALAQSRLITNSTAEAGGSVQLTLSQPLLGAIANGTTVSIITGCDGLKSTCGNKYSNFANFGGFPFVPVMNPTLTQTSSINQGKK